MTNINAMRKRKRNFNLCRDVCMMCVDAQLFPSASVIQRLAIMQTPVREIIKAVMDRNIDEWLNK